MNVSFFGTTTLLFDDGADQVLFDCHVTRPCFFKAFFGRFESDNETVGRIIKDFSINRLRGIFISHSHYDHVLDVAGFQKASGFEDSSGCEVFGSESALNVCRGGNVEESKLHSYDDSKEFSVGEFNITVLPSLHSKPYFFNNDLGKTIDRPLVQPARMKEFAEGGSFDFFVKHHDKTYLIRPSCNYIKGQLDGIKADTVFLGIAGLSKMSIEERAAFFAETVEKTRPSKIIPIHWDNFFKALNVPVKEMKQKDIDIAKSYCDEHNIEFLLQIPLTTITL